MVEILQVDGIRYAADVMSGQKQFPSFNKIQACEELRLLREKIKSS